MAYPLTFSFALLVGVIFVIAGDTGTAVTGGVLLGYGAVLISARACLQRGRRNVTVAMICVGLLAGTLVGALVQLELVFRHKGSGTYHDSTISG